MANLIVEAVPQHQTGVATGMNTIMRSIGGALGAQIAAAIVTGHLEPEPATRQSPASRPPSRWERSCWPSRWRPPR